MIKEIKKYVWLRFEKHFSHHLAWLCSDLPRCRFYKAMNLIDRVAVLVVLVVIACAVPISWFLVCKFLRSARPTG